MGPDSGAGPPGDKALGRATKSAGDPSPAAEESLKHLDGNGVDAQSVPDPPPGHILKAADFRYDRTGLPRYAQSVTTTASTLYHAADSTAYHSTAAIITSNRFQDVVDWYRSQLPPGWNVQVMGDVGALAKQVSIANIMTTLTAAAQSKGGSSGGAMPNPPPGDAASGNALSIATFAPPPDLAGDPTIMVQQSSDGTVEITMSKDGIDP
ncbi:MAG TPA: hypothetical protein VGI93_04090 [Steroidobacteraceae bacterium]